MLAEYEMHIGAGPDLDRHIFVPKKGILLQKKCDHDNMKVTVYECCTRNIGNTEVKTYVPTKMLWLHEND